MRLSLAVPLHSRNGLPFSDSYIMNGYVQGDTGTAKAVKRPGLLVSHDYSPAVGQAMFEIAGTPYAILGDVIYLAEAPWSSFAIPSITTADLPYDVVAQPPYIATPYAVIKSTAGMWTFDGAAVTKVTDVDYPAETVPGLCYLDGAYYVKTPTGQIFGSDLGTATSWTALNFLTASDAAGLSVAIESHLNYVVSFGEASMTFYYNANNPTPGSPLGYAANLTQSMGCAAAGSIEVVGDNLIFMANVDKGRSIAMLAEQSLVPTPISKPGMNGILAKDDLVGISSFSVAIAGRYFYFLTLPTTGVTFVYNLIEQHWSYWASGTTLAPVSVILELDANLTTVYGTLISGSLLPGVSFLISGADNPIFNGRFAVLTSDGVNFTFELLYDAYLVTESGDFLVTEAGEYIVATEIPVAGAVSGAITLSEYGTTRFSAIASAGDALILDEASGELLQLSVDAYSDASGAIDFNIITPNIESEHSGQQIRIGAAEVKGDKVQATSYLRYTDNDYGNWSAYRPVAMAAIRSRIVRLGSTHRRAFHFRSLADAPIQVQELVLDLN